MPKLYEYFGIIVLFYSNEHEPIHVHGQCQGRESKAEIIVENGKVVQLVYSSVKGRRPPSQAGSPPHPLPGRLVPALVFPDERGLSKAELKNFQTVIERYAEEIV